MREQAGRPALEARNEAPRHDQAERRDFSHLLLMHEDVRPPEGDLRARAEDQCERRADRELAFDEGGGAREQVRAPDRLGVVRRQVGQRLVEQDRVGAQREGERR